MTLAVYPTMSTPHRTTPRQSTAPRYSTSCASCDAAASAGATPGTVAEIVVRGDGTREVHRIPDPALNDVFYPGSRSFSVR
jgi:hypothetical protein